jgi:hypothetical protein
MPTCLHAHMPSCSHAFIPTCSHAHMLTCSHAHMLTCPHAHMPTCLRLSFAVRCGLFFLVLTCCVCVCVLDVKLSPDGMYLLSNSMDCTLKCWDVRPYVSNTRLVNTFQGAQHDLQQWLIKCSWSGDGKRIASGM